MFANRKMAKSGLAILMAYGLLWETGTKVPNFKLSCLVKWLKKGFKGLKYYLKCI